MERPDPALHRPSTPPCGLFRLSRGSKPHRRRTGKTPARVAQDLAESRSFEKHPVWGHRGVQIIRSLVDSGWARG